MHEKLDPDVIWTTPTPGPWDFRSIAHEQLTTRMSITATGIGTNLLLTPSTAPLQHTANGLDCGSAGVPGHVMHWILLHVQAVQNLVRKYQENYVESEESGEREFWVALYNLPKKLALRGLKTQQIGRLVSAGTCLQGFCSVDCATSRHCTQG